ncbi:hypothetical protein [Azospirillum aestuarii]|uniref:hypothetical protein n=1 Tax=Azospirillum aestuarii TaxID=2802052 RepID=UPI0040553157
MLPLLSLLIGTSPAQQDRAARRFHCAFVGPTAAVPVVRRRTARPSSTEHS